MIRRLIRGMATAIVAAMATTATAQTTITQWDFNANTTVPNVGAGSASAWSAPGVALPTTTFDGGGSGGPAIGDSVLGSGDPLLVGNRTWRFNGNPGQGVVNNPAGAEFAVSTVGYQGISFSFDMRISSTASRFIRVLYSTNGGTTYVPGPIFEATNGGDRYYNGRILDLTAVAAANNNPSLRVRITPTYSPAAFTENAVNYAANSAFRVASDGNVYGAGGNTYRYDMITFRGTAVVPTPIQSGSVSVTPGAVCSTGGPFTVTVNVIPGSNPDSAGTVVTANLTSVGGVANAAFTDQGNNVWTLSANVANGTSVGTKTLPITISDNLPRTANTSVQLNVANCGVNSTAPVVISQVYGGGGNLGPPAGQFDSDFIEIFNRSANPVTLDGWSIQYAGPTSAAGFDNPNDRVILSGIIRPGQYKLIRMSDPDINGSPLPTPDFIDSSGDGGMGNTGGRVALVNSTALLGSACNSAMIVDLVGYGAGTICFEGAAATNTTANDTAAIRKVSGSQDTNQNFNDFDIAAPAPRNSATGGFLTGFATLPAQVCAGEALTLNYAVTPAPGSTGIAVFANLSSIGLGTSVPLVSQGNNAFSLTVNVPSGVTQGFYSVTFRAQDAQGRTSTTGNQIGVGNCTSSSAPVVISAFFGGGGNAGSLSNVDYVELHNRTNAPVNIRGWSIQYGDANNPGGFTKLVPLFGGTAPGFNGIMEAGSYLLVQMSIAGSNGFDLPEAPDVISNPAASMDNQFGRIALVNGLTLLGTNCASSNIIDLVGYGATAACFEGLSPAGTLSNTTQALRRDNNIGCRDTQQNGIDFEIVTFTNFPRNRFSGTNVCAGLSCNPADIAGSGATYDNGTVDIGPDSSLGIDDFIIFLAAFSDATGCPGSTPCNPADIAGSGATYSNGTVDVGADGDLGIDDFIVFLAAFSDSTGCQ